LVFLCSPPRLRFFFVVVFVRSPGIGSVLLSKEDSPETRRNVVLVDGTRGTIGRTRRRIRRRRTRRRHDGEAAGVDDDDNSLPLLLLLDDIVVVLLLRIFGGVDILLLLLFLPFVFFSRAPP
jgi:hypothetical protein